MHDPARARPAVSSRATLAVGLLLTVGLFSGYRPWGDTPFNAVFLLGPFVLAASSASLSARPGGPAKSGRSGSPAANVVGLGPMPRR